MTFAETTLAEAPQVTARPSSDTPVKQSALIAKLSHQSELPLTESTAFEQVLAANVRSLAARTNLIEEGSPVSEISVILEGWAYRYALLEEQRRQIVAFYIPGDICDFNAFMFPSSDQTVAALSQLRVAGISRSTLNQVSQRCPRLTHGLWWESACAAAIQRRWTINLAQRSAKRRLAHLLCELATRLDAVGLSTGARYYVPVSQADLGNACGLTPEHTNRTLQELRTDKLFKLSDHVLEILDFDGLSKIACFDPGYLQFVNFDRNPSLDLAKRVFAGG